MNIALHPGIGTLDPGSLCYSLYRQLYQQFFNAQTRKSTENPYGVEEGDDTSIRLHNAAYGFAEAISGSIAGEGGEPGTGGILLGYLAKSGGDMSGPLGADYGFGAGIDNRRVLEIYREAETDETGAVTGHKYGVQVAGDLRIEGDHLYVGGQQFITYIGKLGTMFVRYPKMDFSSSSIRSRGELYFGEDKTMGVYLSSSALRVGGHDVYHSGNAGNADADWTMRNATVAGKLKVQGITEMDGLLRALQGAELGAAGKLLFTVAENGMSCLGDLSFSAGCGVTISGVRVLQGSGAKDVRLEGAGGELLLGGGYTNKVRLMSNLSDTDGEHVLLSKYGAAYFPSSLRVRHNYGSDLLASYRVDSEDEGIVIHRKLRFGDSAGAWFAASGRAVSFVSAADHTNTPGGTVDMVGTEFGHIPSMSLYAPQNRGSNSFCIATAGDFVVSLTPFEATGHVGIAGSLTRLTPDGLFFTEDIRLHRISDGIQHYGNAYFGGSLSSERFSSGMAGSGWAILRSRTTGNVTATFDELTVRKRMRVYELEVQRYQATNGALWVTDSCSGDSVEEM